MSLAESRPTIPLRRGAAFAEAVAGLRGWRRAVLSLALGGASVLGFAPFHLWPVLFFTFPCLVWLLDGVAQQDGTRRKRLWRAAGVGWCFGFGAFVAGLYWIGFAFLVEADKFAWLMPLAISGLPAGLALFYAGAAALAMLAWRRGSGRIFALAGTFFIAEWLRGHILTGFPWNLWGYALAGNDALTQSAALFGIYGLTLLAILIFASPAALAGPLAAERRRWLLPALCLGLLAAGWAYGAVRLAGASDAMQPHIRLRIVQGNIPQADKWKPEKREPNLQTLLDLSTHPQADTGSPPITHLIWPETSIPYLFMLNDAIYVPKLREIFAGLLPEGATMVLGAERVEATPRGDGQFTIDQVFNSLFVLDATAKVTAIYDKMHLVPFGEYVPLEKILRTIGIQQLTHMNSGFASGTVRHLVQAGNAPGFAPLICYEAIFPGRTVVGAEGRPGWLLNLTNDAWFGTSIGPYQHLAQARLRAVEEGLPLVRAANTGISAVVDAYGRTKAMIPLNQAGILDEGLPVALGPTPFSSYGGLSLIVVALMILLLYRVVIAVE